MRVTQITFGAGILSEGMYARDDVEKFRQGLKDAVNVIIRPQGGAQNRAGLESVTAFDTSGNSANQYLLPFSFNRDQTYQVEFTDGKFRIIRYGGYILDTSVGAISLSAITEAAIAQLTLTNSSDAANFNAGCLAYIETPNGDHVLHKTLVQITGAAGATLSFNVYDGSSLDTSSGDWGTVGSGATLSKVYEQTHTYDLADMPNVRIAQDADTIYLAHKDYPPRKLTRTAHDNWAISDVVFGETVSAPTSVSATATIGSGVNQNNLITYTYMVSAVNAENQESLPSAGATANNDLYYEGSKNDVSWTAVQGAERYNVYKQSGGIGYIGSTESLTFTDQNITADTSRGPRIERNPFASSGNYPSQVSFFEQRLVFGATENDPQLVEMSRVGSLENFGTSYPDQADDAFRFRLRSQQVNEIRAFVPHETFTILTSSGEWEIASQGDGEYIRPDKRRLSPISYYGSSSIPPILIGEVALYVEPSGKHVRDVRLRDRSQPPGDLTIIAGDLFNNRSIVSWAYAAANDHVVWVVLDDGAVLSMTYVPEHDIWAWARHIIAGKNAQVKQVSVTHELGRDVAYFVVSREINNVNVTTVERLAHRENLNVKKPYFLDGGSCRTYNQTLTKVSGYLHLRGEVVTVLVDGDEFIDIVVDERGVVDFGPRAGSIISVGLPYSAWIQTLDVIFQIDGVGSSEGLYKSVSEIAVKLEKSRGVSVGQSFDRMNTLKEWDASLVGQPIPIKTHTPVVSVNADWVQDATLFIRQDHALPFTVNALTPKWEING